MAHPFATGDFPRSQIRFATGLAIKGPYTSSEVSPLLHRRVVRTLPCSLIASTRRLFLLTGPHTSTALRPLLPLSQGSSHARRSERHRRFRFGRLRSPAFAPLLQPQPTQWKRQFLNFFGCPGSAAPPLPGLSRRVASRRLRKLTAPSARASQSS